MEKEIILPSHHTRESLFVSAAVIGILCIAGILITLHQRKNVSATITAAQIRVFHELSSNEQAIYGNLAAAQEEITAVHEDAKYWMPVHELETLLIPPFVQDSVWNTQGALRWTQYTGINTEGISYCAYVGISSAENTGSFILLFSEPEHSTAQFSEQKETAALTYSIWYTKQPVGVPFNLFSHSALIQAGWKEAVPYTGNDERKRTKGV
ncbi:MAG: hypothetical protein P1P65_07295 [Treponema sp.]